MYRGLSGETTKSWSADIQMLVEMGYIVLGPNPRGSIGRGKSFEDANDEDWGGGDYRDYEHGLRYLAKRFGIPSQRIGMAGFSFGGYMTNWSVTRPNGPFGFGISMAGVSDLMLSVKESVVASNTISDMGDPEKNQRLYRERSPIHWVRFMDVPLLLIHGQRDNRTLTKQSHLFNTRLKEAGKPVTFVEIPGEGHGFRALKSQQASFQAQADFLSRVAFVPDGELATQTMLRWQQAGAQMGWMGPGELSDIGGLQFFDASTTPDDDWLPAFRFQNWDIAQAAKLPVPETPFGLSVSGTEFGNDDLDLLVTWDQIEVLDASRSGLADAGLPALPNLNQLRRLSLYLGFTNVTSDGLIELKRLPQIESLDVGHTLCDDRVLAEWSKLPKLHTLRLANTQVTPLGLAEFAEHPRLQVLDLSSNDIDDEWIDTLAKLPNLRRLNLSATKVGQTQLNGLDQLANLEELDLSFSKTTDSALPVLSNLERLQKLDLRGCVWSEESIQTLRSKLPSCEIVFQTR